MPPPPMGTDTLWNHHHTWSRLIPGWCRVPGPIPDIHTVTARCRAKAAELTATGTKTSFRTVQRMRARYRDLGL